MACLSTDGTRLTIRQGGGRLALAGLPCLGIGLVVAGSLAGVLPSTAPSFPGYARLALAVLAAAFLLVGGGMVFGRRWTVIDSERRTVQRYVGLLRPMRGRDVSGDDYAAVTLSFTAGDADTSDQFSVVLHGRSGALCGLLTTQHFAEARTCALAVAAHLGIDVEDRSSEHPLCGCAEQVDRSLVERLRDRDQGSAGPPRPPGMQTHVEHDGNGVRIVIPNPPVTPVAVTLMSLPAVLSLWLAAPLRRFAHQANTAPPIAWLFLVLLLALVAVPIGTVAIALLRARRGFTRLVVSPAGIHVDEHLVVRTVPRLALAAHDILDVSVTPNGAVFASAPRDVRRDAGASLTIKGRDALTTLGRGLQDAEVRYLNGLIRLALLGRVR